MSRDRANLDSSFHVRALDEPLSRTESGTGSRAGVSTGAEFQLRRGAALEMMAAVAGAQCEHT